MNGFALISERKPFEDVTDSLPGPYAVDPETYCKASGQESALRYIPYVLFDMLYDEMENNALYDLGTNKSKLNEFQVPEIQEIL